MNLFSIFDLVLCALSAYVGFYHMILFIHRRDSIDKLHFSLLCFAIALNNVTCIGLYNSTSVQSGKFWQIAQFFCASIISLEFINFTYCLINKKSDVLKKILLGLTTLVILLGIFLSQYILDQQPMERVITIFGTSITYYEHKPGIIWNFLFILQLSGMCYLYYSTAIEFTIKKQKDLFPIIIGFFFFCFGSS